jgi:SAM-dependent methyltransferase
MNTVTFLEHKYPAFIAEGNHAQYILPIAKQVLKNKNIGVDIGCKKPEWAYPGAILADIALDNNPWHAMNLPNPGKLEYIFSSHCLEHLPNWVSSLHYWEQCLAPGGVLFLYLPHTDCEYWDRRFMPSKRHLHNFKPSEIEYFFKQRLNLKNVFSSERDAAYSFCVYGEKSGNSSNNR